jgi:hypothetical protein
LTANLDVGTLTYSPRGPTRASCQRRLNSGVAEASTIITLIKKFAILLAAIIVVGAVFNLGQRLRLAALSASLRRPNMISEGSLRGTAFLVSSRPIDSRTSTGAQGFLPAVNVADAAPSSSGSSDGMQIDDLLNSDSPAATFQQVYLLLKKEFVDQISDDTPLAHGAASALVESLGEPNSRFLEAPERKALEQQASGLYEGIGAGFTVRKTTTSDGLDEQLIEIIDPLPGSPADKAGLKTGDDIVGVDGHWVISYDPFAAQAKLFKKLAQDEFDLDKAVDATEQKVVDGYSLSKTQTLLDTTSTQPLKLTIQRAGEAKTFDVILDVSAPTQVKDVESRTLADGSGYVIINAFTDSTANDFATAVQGLGTVKGLVIDLRDCSGGELARPLAKSTSGPQ